MKTEAVKIDSKLVQRYRKLSKKTLMPMARMIERAMMDWIPVFESTGNKLQRELGELRKELTQTQ